MRILKPGDGISPPTMPTILVLACRVKRPGSSQRIFMVHPRSLIESKHSHTTTRQTRPLKNPHQPARETNTFSDQPASRADRRSVIHQHPSSKHSAIYQETRYPGPKHNANTTKPHKTSTPKVSTPCTNPIHSPKTHRFQQTVKTHQPPNTKNADLNQQLPRHTLTTPHHTHTDKPQGGFRNTQDLGDGATILSEGGGAGGRGRAFYRAPGHARISAPSIPKPRLKPAYWAWNRVRGVAVSVTIRVGG